MNATQKQGSHFAIDRDAIDENEQKMIIANKDRDL